MSVTLTFTILDSSPEVQTENIQWTFRDLNGNSFDVPTNLLTTSFSNLMGVFSSDRLSLTLSGLTNDFEGTYTMTATNEAGSDSETIELVIHRQFHQSCTFCYMPLMAGLLLLTVSCPPSPVMHVLFLPYCLLPLFPSPSVPPTVQAGQESIVGIQEMSVTLTFSISDASPEVQTENIQWTFRDLNGNNINIPTNPLTTTFSNLMGVFSSDRLSLTLSGLTNDFEGMYVMTATNEAGSDSATVELVIESGWYPFLCGVFVHSC